jgi:ketosteroid isomerase-like protein
MLDREQIKGLIDQAYRARDAQDIDGTMAVFHPEAQFQLAGSDEHSKAAIAVRGHHEFREALVGLVAAFQFVERTRLRILIDGDHAAVHSRVRLRFIPKNLTVTTDILDLFRVADGKIIELIEFVDTALVNELMR